MKFISFIEKHQDDVIEKVATSLRSVAAASRQPVSLRSALKHCGLWQDKRNRGPPFSINEHLYIELEYVSCEDVLMDTSSLLIASSVKISEYFRFKNTVGLLSHLPEFC